MFVSPPFFRISEKEYSRPKERFFLYKVIATVFSNNLLLLCIQAFETEIPNGKKTHFLHFLYLAFRRDKKARDSCAAYDECAIAAKLVCHAQNGSFDLDDMSHSGHPDEFDEDHLKVLLKEDGRKHTRKVNINTMTTSCHLKLLDFTQKLGSWIHMGLSRPTEKNAFKLLLNISPDTEQHTATRNDFY